MRYKSTRGGVDPVSFSDAVMMGLGTDGGLLLPEQIPQISGDELVRWSSLSFVELAVEVMLPYVQPDLSRLDLETLVKKSYSTFVDDDVTPLVKLGDSYILELFHGPTAAFKDVALQFLGNLFELLLERKGGQLNIIGATSGDTGSAAIYGVRGQALIDIFILHPHKKVSPIQERQMTTVLDTNVHNIAIEGTFDDGQRIVKEIFNDLDFKKDYQLGAVNSINWARILAQVVYYFYAWGKVAKGDLDYNLAYSVPTGNFGDIFAGFIAKKMGLPIDKLILATNSNDILSRFVHSGCYEAGKVYQTMSPSMDIQVSSNFERYLYFLMDEDPAVIRQLMDEMAVKGKFSIPSDKLPEVQSLFFAKAVNEEETSQQMKQTYQETGYILDPHTAVGVSAASAFSGAVCLATAHPAKFGDAVKASINLEAEPPASLQGLMEKESRCVVLPAKKEKIMQFMKDTLANKKKAL